MTQAEQVMLRYNYLMSVTSAQSGDFARTSGTWANQIRLLTLNFQQLSATLGQGLIAAVLPAIQALNALMAKLIQAAETFRNFIYTLVGKKVEGSQKGIEQDFGGIGDYSTGLEDIGSAGDTAAGGLDDAASAAENLKDALSVLPFDQLNQLTSNLDSAGSGGSGGGAGGSGGGVGGLGGYDFDDIGSAFDDLSNADVTPINEWARRIRNAFLDHDWDRLGDEIAWGINVGLQKIYDVINWKNVGPKIEAFTDAFTQTFNSLVDHINWDLLGRTVGAGLNTITNTVNGFVTGINWVNIGNKFSEGINGFVREVDWYALGDTIGNYFMISWDIFQGIVTGLEYEEIGHSIENGISAAINAINLNDIAFTLATGMNGIVTTAITIADDFDFSGFGERIGNSLNTFFNTFDFGSIGTAINKWVNGILDAIISFVDTTDWGKIGDQIGDFLAEIDFLEIGKKIGKAIWKAINAGFEIYEGMFETAPLETALLSLVGITKAVKSTNIKNFIKAIKNGLGTVKDFGKALGGSTDAMESLQKTTPKVSKVVSALRDTFSAFKTGVTKGNWLTGISSAFDNIRQSMSKMQKGVVTAVSAFAEFSVLKDTFKDLITGSGDLGTNIAELAVTAGTTAASMYAALGPAGLVVSAVTGLIGLFSGIGDAINQIETERFSENVKQALTEPGGVTLEEISTQYETMIQGISEGFTGISEASANLDTANRNIQSTQTEIQRIQTSMDSGVISVEEGTQRLSELFGTLETVVSEKFQAMETVLISAFGEGGTLEKTYQNMGINTQELVQTTMQINDQAMERIKEIAQELSTMDPSNPKYSELQQEMYNLMGTTDELETVIQNYQTFVDSTKINYGNLVAEDGSLNTEYLETTLGQVVTLTQNAQGDASEAFSVYKETLTEGLNQAIAIDDKEAIDVFQKSINALPEALNTTNTTLSTRAQEITDTIQTDMIGNINDIIAQAQEDWNNMEPLDPIKLQYTSAGLGEDSYIKDKVSQYKSKVIDPLSGQIESTMNQLGIDGAGWSNQATQEIIDGLFDTDVITYPGGSTIVTTLNENWRSIINDATDGLKGLSEQRGADVINGFNNGIESNDDLVGPVQTWQDKVNAAIHDSIMDYGSPSKKAEEYGENTIIGYNNGVEKKSDATKVTINNWMNKIELTMKSKLEQLVRTSQIFGEDFAKSIGQGFDIQFFHIQNMIQNVVNTMRSMNNALWNAGYDAGQSFANGFQSVHIPTPHLYVSSWSNQDLGNNQSMSVPRFDVDWYAIGGLFQRPTIAGLGEKGREAVLPLENRRTMGMIADSILGNGKFGIDEETMTNAVSRGVAMAMMNNQGNQPNITVYAELKTEDDEVLARAVTRGQRKMDYRMHATPQMGEKELKWKSRNL